jgi:hypothetical protein
MQRDVDLVRAILLKLEEYPHGFAPKDVKFRGSTANAERLRRCAHRAVVSPDSPEPLALAARKNGSHTISVGARHSRQRAASGASSLPLRLRSASARVSLEPQNRRGEPG